MVNVQICIPWCPDGGHRDELWAYCRNQWLDLDLGWPIVTGTNADEPLNRSKARNDAARGDWDVAVFADADIIVPTAHQVRSAVQVAQNHPGQVYGFITKHMLTEAATEDLLSGRDEQPNLHGAETAQNTFSSLFAMSRHHWDLIGGFDERFRGWGFEDLAFMYAAETMGIPAVRIPGQIYDLWHPRPRALQEEGPTYPANEALWHRYRAALGRPRAMEKLIRER